MYNNSLIEHNLGDHQYFYGLLPIITKKIL